MLDRRELLNGVIAAVVVSKEQSVRRYYLACAASTKDYDSILKRRFLGRVDILGLELTAVGLHILLIHLLDVGQ